MFPDTASRPSPTLVHAVPVADDAMAARWRQWQARNVVTSRKDARRARVAFIVVFAALGVWLGRLWLAPSL